MNVLLVAALLALAPAQPAEAPGQTRSIALDPATPTKIHTVIAKPQVRTAIQMPEAWIGAPQCGDCVLNDQPVEGQLWRLIIEAPLNTVYISPTRLPGRDVPESAFETNLSFMLASGVPVTIAVKLDYTKTSDWRVIFTLPDSKTAASCEERAKATLEDEFAGRVRHEAEQMSFKSLIHGTRCRDFAGGPRRTDRMVVRPKQLCRNDTMVYLVVEVENRGREDLKVGDMLLVDQDGAESTRSFFENRTLKFNDRTNGVVVFPIEDPTLPPGTYEVSVLEEGGLDREVRIGGLTIRDTWFFGIF